MAELEQMHSMLVEMLGRFDEIDRRFDGMDQRFDGIDRRFDGVDQRFDGVDQRFDGIDETLQTHGKRLRWLKRKVKKLGLDFEEFRSDNRAVTELLREEDLVKRLEAVEKENGTFDDRLSNLELAPGSEHV